TGRSGGPGWLARWAIQMRTPRDGMQSLSYKRGASSEERRGRPVPPSSLFALRSSPLHPPDSAMRYSILTALLILTPPASAQTFPTDDPVIKRIYALGMASSRTP